MLMQSDIIGSMVWFVLLFVFFFLYPRIILHHTIFRIEQSALRLENMSKAANKMVCKKVGDIRTETRDKVGEFTDFFVVEPSNIDPYGLVQKVDQLIRGMEVRFSEFVDDIAGKKSYSEKQEINYGLRAAIGLRQISKTVRHFSEIAKKFKNLQVAMILQMQLPIIEKIAESELRGTEAFVNGWPIGDSIGPLVAASYMSKPTQISEDVMVDKVTIANRTCFVFKAKGPAPHLGRIDEGITSIMKKNKIARVVTIDAAQKLEGEPSGGVAEGVGFAMGGVGQREMIENVLLPKKIPIDSIVIKVGMAEAIMPMKKEVYDALPKARMLVEKAIGRSKKGEKVIVIGVGNSSGISDTSKSVDEVKSLVMMLDKKYKAEAKQNKKNQWD